MDFHLLPQVESKGRSIAVDWPFCFHWCSFRFLNASESFSFHGIALKMPTDEEITPPNYSQGNKLREPNPSNSLVDHQRAGGSIRTWANSRGFNPRLVYAILRGERKCLRGESHKIAKELGMK